MAEQGKQQISEAESITRPPLFTGDNYFYWKNKMEMFIKSTQYSLWKVITKGDYIPTNSEGQAINEDEWTVTQMYKVQENFRAKFILSCALCKNEYDKVCSYKTAKDIWDRLSFIYENKETGEEEEVTSDKSEASEEEAHMALIAETDSDSEDESKVRKQLSDLKEAYENLLKDSQVLITHCSVLKRKIEKLIFQLSEKDKEIQELSNKDLDLTKKTESLLSQDLSYKSDNSKPSDEVKLLQQKVEELTADLAKHVNDKSGLGYKKDERHTTKVKMLLRCSICGKYEHSGNRCCYKKKPQASDTNPKGPKKVWVPRKFNVFSTDEPGRWSSITEMNLKAADTYIS